MSDTGLPEHISPLAPRQPFSFRCHPDISCFNECCRELELSLTPFDVARLRQALGLSSRQFLEQYTLYEFEPGDAFPRIYLGMVDDGRASCPFVTAKGCQVYENRPGACRTYPLARGASRQADGSIQESFLLLKEPHCHGFKEQHEVTIATWYDDQGLVPYNKTNDLLTLLNQHQKIKEGMLLNPRQADIYINCLYDLDGFRNSVAKDNQPPPKEILENDESLLAYAISWVHRQLFAE